MASLSVKERISNLKIAFPLVFPFMYWKIGQRRWNMDGRFIIGANVQTVLTPQYCRLAQLVGVPALTACVHK